MGLAEMLPWITQGGVVGVVAWVFASLHRSAVRAHDLRAADWRAAYEAERARADEAGRQLAHVLGALKTPTGTA